MARYAVIVDGKVVNVVEAEVGWTPAEPGAALAPALPDVQPGYLWDSSTQTFSATIVPIDVRRAIKADEVQRQRDALLARGAPYGGKRVEVDDATRANLSGMALLATLALLGMTPGWPQEYARGWITLDNSRIPLPNPGDGLMLASTVAGWYAGVVQHGRDIKDAILASDTPETVVLDWSEFEG